MQTDAEPRVRIIGRQFGLRVRPAVIAISVICMLVPSGLAGDAPVKEAANQPSLLLEPASARFNMITLREHASDPSFPLLVLMAQFERQGQVSTGTTAQVAARIAELGRFESAPVAASTATPTETTPSSTPTPTNQTEPPEETFSEQPAPQYIYRDIRPTCDVDGDGETDFVSNANTYYTESWIEAFSGRNGSALWTVRNDFFSFLPSPAQTKTQDDGWYIPQRHRGRIDQASYKGTGEPEPTVLNLGPDVNGDGVCDFLVIGLHISSRLPTETIGSSILDVTGRVAMLNGRTGATIWANTFNVEVDDIVVGPPLFGLIQAESYKEFGFPTGLLFYNASSGPKFVLKTTDFVYAYEGRGGTSHYVIVENVTLGNAADGTSIWTRSMDGIEQGGLPDEWVNTWLTGAVDLGGDPDPEILLDTQVGHNWHARDLAVRALKGETNAKLADFWQTFPLPRPVSYYTPPPKDPSLTEVLQSEPVMSDVRIINDVNGDHRPDIVGLYYASIAGGIGGVAGGTQKGNVNTHIAPIDGAKGKLFWPGKDIYQEGWGGQATDLNPSANESRPYIALGTADQTAMAALGARFPLLEVFVTVYDVRDATHAWVYSHPFAYDSSLSYLFSVRQYFDALSGPDVNGDGVRDVVTPERFDERAYGFQVLRSNQRHEYQILDAMSGRPSATFTAPGPFGRVVACPGEAPDQITTFSGNVRRWVISRFNATDGQLLWHEVMYNEPTMDPQTVGALLTFAGTFQCRVDPTGETSFAFDLQIVSSKRHAEIVPVFGKIGLDGRRAWVMPPIRGHPIIDSIIEPFEDLAAAPSPGLLEKAEKPTMGAGAGLGIGAGVGAASAWVISMRRLKGA